MIVHGLIHQFPKEIKLLLVTFLTALSVGFIGGLTFVNETTSMESSEIESHYLGNENDEEAEIMKFKKNKREILTLVHNHILSMSVIFFLLALILATTSFPIKLKYILMIEPFISILLTFGGIYILWLGVTWFKYVIMISGVLMTLSFVISVILVFYNLFFQKIEPQK